MLRTLAGVLLFTNKRHMSLSRKNKTSDQTGMMRRLIDLQPFIRASVIISANIDKILHCGAYRLWSNPSSSYSQLFDCFIAFKCCSFSDSLNGG